MKTNFTKQTSQGPVTIEIENGTATVADKCTCGFVTRFPKAIEKNGSVFVGGICGIALTADECKEVEAALKLRDAAPVATGSRAAFKQTMREVRGDINQFAKGGAL